MTNRNNHSPDLKELLCLPTQRAEEFVNWMPDGEQPSQNPVSNPHRICNLSEPETKFLRAVVENPGQPSSRYAKLAGMGTHQAIAIRKRLIEQDFLREHRVNTGSRGPASKILETTRKATELLGKGSK